MSSNPHTGRGFRARLHGRLWLLCLGAIALALAWQAWMVPRLIASLPPLPGTFWTAMLLSAVLLGTALFFLLRRLRPGRDDELAARLRRQQHELQALAGRLIDLQETERRTLSRELHDDIGQAITAIKLGVLSIDGEDEAVRAEIVQEIVSLADQTIAKLRDISMLLRPPQLDALGLEAALRWQGERLFRASPAQLELQLAPLAQRPDPAVELACFRIAQEALTNVLRHADARHVTLTLSPQRDGLMLSILDDGRGVAPDRIDGLGLLTMRERAQLLGGYVEIETESGAGTCVRAHLPLCANQDTAPQG
jgi:signal transduction histidine kinase